LIRFFNIFRILRIKILILDSILLKRALIASNAKIIVFLLGVLIACVICGTIMFGIENKETGFTSIPQSIYWCIVTLTTVGYGDITPQTDLGKFISSFIMILGYVIIAIPTGIISVKISEQLRKIDLNSQVCPHCMENEHKDKAIHCHSCGNKLN